jgi:hypothetical protein
MAKERLQDTEYIVDSASRCGRVGSRFAQDAQNGAKAHEIRPRNAQPSASLRLMCRTMAQTDPAFRSTWLASNQNYDTGDDQVSRFSFTHYE